MVRVLSIDDSKVVHKFIDSLFAAIESQVSHAYDGEEGLNILKQRWQDFDVVLLDWEMPKLNGIETLRGIRAAGIKLPIIMVTTKNEPSDIEMALNMGANEYIMKPFVSDIVFDKLEAVLERPVK